MTAKDIPLPIADGYIENELGGEWGFTAAQMLTHREEYAAARCAELEAERAATVAQELAPKSIPTAHEFTEAMGWNMSKAWKTGFDECRDLVLALASHEQPPQEPVAFCHVEQWLTGRYWPDDCFCSIQLEGMTPLYLRASTCKETKP